jgi:hypothetical protein
VKKEKTDPFNNHPFTETLEPLSAGRQAGILEPSLLRQKREEIRGD